MIGPHHLSCCRGEGCFRGRGLPDRFVQPRRPHLRRAAEARPRVRGREAAGKHSLAFSSSTTRPEEIHHSEWCRSFLLLHAHRGIPRLCDLLLRRGSPPGVVAPLAAAALAAASEDPAVLDFMAAQRRGLPEEVVRLWYQMGSHQGARVNIEKLMARGSTKGLSPPPSSPGSPASLCLLTCSFDADGSLMTSAAGWWQAAAATRACRSMLNLSDRRLCCRRVVLGAQVCLMDTDAGAIAIADAVGEGPALALVNDLRYRRAVDAAVATVRSIPEAESARRSNSLCWLDRENCAKTCRAGRACSTRSPWAWRRPSPRSWARASKARTEVRTDRSRRRSNPVVVVVVVTLTAAFAPASPLFALLPPPARELELASVDASALAAYLMTVLPPYGGVGDRQPVVVDVCSGTVRPTTSTSSGREILCPSTHRRSANHVPSAPCGGRGPWRSCSRKSSTRTGWWCTQLSARGTSWTSWPGGRPRRRRAWLIDGGGHHSGSSSPFSSHLTRGRLDAAPPSLRRPQASNAVPVFCEDALDGVPVAADVLVFVAAWTELLTDDEEAMNKARTPHLPRTLRSLPRGRERPAHLAPKKHSQFDLRGGGCGGGSPPRRL